MIYAYSVDTIREVERRAIDRDGDATLMRRASTALANEIAVRLPSPLPGARAVLLVGSGNNGGDALFAGAFLRRRGLVVTAIVTDVGRAHLAGMAALLRARGRIVTADDAAVPALIAGADVIVDGLIGLSAKPPLRPPADALVGMANAADALRVAVDLPSGIEPDTGIVRGIAFLADVTVTFGGIKSGLLLADAQSGTVVCDPIGMDLGDRGPDLIAMTDGAVDRLLPAPDPDADKFSGGLLGIAAGSPGYPGAPVLCTGGAVRTRPGMVRYAGAQASAVLARWPEVVAAAEPQQAGQVQAWVVGPGMGTDDEAAARLEWVLDQDVPVLVDADGLTLLASRHALLGRRRRAGRDTVLTPHGREFARVFPDVDLTDRVGAVRAAAAASGATVLLKGHRTVVASPAGAVAVNLSGTPWLATAGAGDVLSGVIGSLLAAGLPPLIAAAAGAHIHGRAGERAQSAGQAGAQALWDHLRT